MKKIVVLIIMSNLLLSAQAQQGDTVQRKTLTAVSIKSKSTGLSRLGGAENGQKMGQEVLFRAACCNLGESFVANPSVDVN